MNLSLRSEYMSEKNKDRLLTLALCSTPILFIIELGTGLITTVTGMGIIKIAEIMITFGNHLIRV